MDKQKIETLTRLEELSTQLKLLTFPSSPISIETAHFIAESLDKFLRGDEKITLDAAFGLTPKRGAPPKIDEHLDLATEIFSMKLKGKTGPEISDELSNSGCSITDEREQRRIYRKHKTELISEELSRRIDLRDQGDKD